MAQNYSPKIITDGLVMCLDPSQNKSYPTTDLPIKDGLVMWMDAADDTTFSYSSGTTVSQWRDKSGLNYHMTPAAPLSTGPSRNTSLNSRKTLTFTTSQSIGSLTFTVETSANTVFVVSRLTGGANGRVLTAYYNNWLLGHWGGLVNPYYAEGWVYYPPNSADTVWRIYMGDWGGPSNDLAAAYSNGTVLNSGSSVASAGPKGLGINYQSGEPSNCEAAEIIVFNRLLSTKERNLIHTYLGQKWGIFNTDRQIFDLSGNNYNFSFNGSNPRYNAKSIVSNFNTTSPYAVSSFGGQNLTNTILNLLYVDHTIEVAVNLKGFKAVKSFDNPRDYEGGAGIVLWQGYHGGLYVDSVTQKLTYLIWNSDPTNVYIEYALPNDLKDKILYITAKRQANVLSIFINGVLVAGPANITTTVRSYTQINIGAAFQGDPSSGGSLGAFVWAGQHEYHLLRMYNKALSASEIVSNYQAFKARFDNNIVRFGLILDLDAGNPYSYAGAGTTWYDVSGNGYNGILSGGPTYSTTNGGILNLDGLDDHCFSTVASIPASSTVAIWIKSSAYSGNKIPISIDGDSYGSGPNIYFSESKINWNTGDGAANAFTNSSYPDSNWHYIVVTNDSSTNAKLYIDGTLIGTASYRSTLSTVTSNFWIGKFHAGGYEIAASIGQVQLYNRVLSATEVLQNYNATKGRFGL